MPWQQHIRWLFFSLGNDEETQTNLKNTSASWKIKQQWTWKHQTAPSFYLRPLGDLTATVSLSVSHFWKGRGGGGVAADLCCRWGILTFSDNSNPPQNKGQASSPVWALCLQLKYWDALCQNVKGKNTQRRFKKKGGGGGMAVTSNLNQSLLGLSAPDAVFFLIMKWVGNKMGETEQKEQHLHVWL